MSAIGSGKEGRREPGDQRREVPANVQAPRRLVRDWVSPRKGQVRCHDDHHYHDEGAADKLVAADDDALGRVIDPDEPPVPYYHAHHDHLDRDRFDRGR